MSVELPEWAPTSLDLNHPSAARVWDYFLSGSHNFAVDRQVAEAAIAMKPDMPELAMQVRRSLRSAVGVMTEAGITRHRCGHSHRRQRARRGRAGLSPDVHVAYIDHDPVAVAQILDRDGGNA
jgi:hypothetical protein